MNGPLPQRHKDFDLRHTRLVTCQ